MVNILKVSNNSKYIKKFISVLNLYGLPENLPSRFFSAYFLVSIFQIILARRHEIDPIFDWKSFVSVFPLVAKMLWVIIFFLWISILYCFIPKKQTAIDHIILMVSVVVFSLSMVWKSGSFYLGVAAAAIAVVFVVYAMGKIKQESFEWMPDLPVGIIVFVTAAMVIGFIAVITIVKHLSFRTPCFDMGIFVQTFYSLKEHFTAVITCERAEMLSHFRVHSSFIFYLFLPIYALSPKGETLLAGQAFFAIAGVVPLFLMAKKHSFKGFALISICFMYVFCSGLILPCFFYFHENAFLPTILMWLLYAVDQRNIPLFYIMSVLTCIVKEDAPLYVIFIALFFLFEEKDKKRKHGLIIAVLSMLYFIIIMRWLTNYGDGVHMTTSRFGALMIDNEDGFIGIIRNVLVDPSYLISLFLQESTLLFFVQTMLPLLFLPFMTKKLHRFLLMVPYVIMNLVIGAGYGYAANIGFHYIFGPACLLIYMSFRNVEDLPRERRNTFLVTAAIITMVTTFSMTSKKLEDFEMYKETKEVNQKAMACIQLVPEDASVLANTFLLPHTANRDQVYELDDKCFAKDDNGNVVDMPGLEKYDFCVFSKNDPLTEQARPFLETEGWTVYAESEEHFVIIFVSPDY